MRTPTLFPLDSPTGARRRHRIPMPVIVVWCMVMLLPGICSADRWYQDFEQAVELIDKGECSREAIRKLGAAQVDKKKPNMNARTVSTRTIEYLPYYQLARAHYNCGEYEAARDYVAESRRWDVAPPGPLAEIERLIKEGEEQVARDAEAKVDTSDLARSVSDASESIRLARSVSDLVRARRGDLQFVEVFQKNSAVLQQAGEDLRTAEEQLADGSLRRDAATIESAQAAANRALEAYSAVQAEIAAVRRAPPTAAPTVPPTATQPVRPTSRPEVRPTRAPPTPVPRRPVEQREPEVPEPLRRAAADFLEAEYEIVVNELQPYYISGERQQAAAHLLRAAAQFALYCIDGRTDEGSLNQVRRDIDQCRDIDPSVVPDTRFFSPEFITLFESTR
jgi:hypothetical protein